MGDITRRGLLGGAVGAVLSPYLGRAMRAEDRHDPGLSVFLSDIHVSGPAVRGQPTYQNPLFERTVDRILAMRPLPARVVVFGDVALWVGRHEDYEASLPAFDRMRAAGIGIFVTTGNHDHRDVMFRYHPRQAGLTPVPGRFVSVIDLGSADLLLLDTLREDPRGEGAFNAVGGELDDRQWAWLEEESAKRTRPFFVGAHHQPDDLNGRNVRKTLYSRKNFVGWIHGHDHKWMRDWFHDDSYAERKVCPLLGLPSTGWWGDIGFTTFRTFADHAELALEQDDFFFPRPLEAGESRPAAWDERLRANRGSVCRIPYT